MTSYSQTFIDNTNNALTSMSSQQEEFPVYVMHYTPFKERKEHMIEQCKKHSFNPIFVESCDREKLTEGQTGLFNLNLVNMREISLFCKHINALKHMQSSNVPYGLILEDDALLDDTFNQMASLYISQLPTNWDMLFLGNSFNFHIPQERISLETREKHTNVFLKENYPTHDLGGGCTKTTDAFFVSQKCADKLINEINLPNYQITYPYDWFLNYCARAYDLNVFWCEPTIVKHGSMLDVFTKVV